MSLREVSLSELGLLPPRDPTGHKGTFGTLAVFGGTLTPVRAMPGAPALCAAAALRAGAGLCVVHAPGPLLAAILTIVPSATGVALPVDAKGEFWKHLKVRNFAELLVGEEETGGLETRPPRPADAAVIGPGLGTGVGQRKLVGAALQQGETPIVLDADGLNCIPLLEELTLPVPCPLVVTPHPGEFDRIARALDITGSATDEKSRPEAAAALAAKMGCIVVLKGQQTIVTDGKRFYRNESGSAALATGGTGDVLSGLIGGLIAQFVPKDGSGIEPPLLFKLAALGVHAHGTAADLWCERHRASAGLTAVELCGMLPEALEGLREKP